MTLRDRLRFTCSVTAPDGTPCARSEPHGTEDIHANAGRSWGFREVPAEWVRRALEGRLPYRVEGGTAR